MSDDSNEVEVSEGEVAEVVVVAGEDVLAGDVVEGEGSDEDDQSPKRK